MLYTTAERTTHMEVNGPTPLDEYQHEQDDAYHIEAGDAVLHSEMDAQQMEVDHSTGFLLGGDDGVVQFQQVDEDEEQ
jgi:hypothetical protein